MTEALRRTSFIAVLYLFMGTLVPGSSQAQTVDLGGVAFIDYFYTVSSPKEADEGFHGFTYRRLNLTTDFVLSEDFVGRARLEASDGTDGPNGPEVFVKDLYLRWTYSGNHSATLGVAPPPAFQVSESVWGYRSLEKTILDLQGIVGSRDFGLRFDGPITPGGMIRYAAMLANNSARSPETDSYKRVYLQLGAFPTERLSFTVGADHAGHDDPLESSTRVSGFAGYAAEAFRVGFEGYWSNREFASGDELAGIGLSLFGAVRLVPKLEAVGRIDRARAELTGSDRFTTFVLGGLAFAPNEFVRLIPNLWLYRVDEDAGSEILGRFTAVVRF